MILGLDCSTKTCGHCLLTNEGQYVSAGFLDFSKEDCLYKKLAIFNTWFKTFLQQNAHNDLTIVIEEAAQFFGKASSAYTMSRLQRYNGMVCSAIFIMSGIEPLSVSSHEIRKAAGLKIPKGIKGKETKKFIWTFVSERGIMPDSAWPRGRKDNLQEQAFDIADGYMCANYGVLTAKSAAQHRDSA